MSLGKVEEFVIGKTNWIEYKERLEFYFTANSITEDAKKRAIFLSVSGSSLYSLIRSLCTPASPSTVEIADLLQKLDNYFIPKPSEILARFKFHKRDQKKSETISEFLAELRKLSENCNFGEQLNSMLRDRLVCGIFDADIQRKLLADSQLTLQSALDVALAGEAALRQADEIRGQTASVFKLKNDFVNKAQGKKGDTGGHPKNKNSCYRCGSFHAFGECKFLNAVCNYCKKVGHIAKVCNLKNNKKFSKGTKTKIHKIDSGKSIDSNDELSFINTLDVVNTVNNYPPHDIIINLNGIKHKMEIDSGSLHSVMSSDTYIKLWPVNTPELLPLPNQCLKTWNSDKLNIMGYFNVDVDCNSVNVNLPLVILEGKGKSLVGRSWFDALGIKVDINNLSINSLSTQGLDSILMEYSEIFSESLGTFKVPPVSIKLDSNATPKFLKARNVPFALRNKVTEKLDDMVNKGILEPVTYSEWATPIVSVVKQNGTIRICGDYRSTVNQAVKQFVYPLPTVNDILTTMSGGTIFSKLDLSEAYLQIPVDDISSKILTLNTHKGLFRVKRLPFGVSVAVAIFQKTIEEVLSGISGVLPYLDDIFIQGKNIEDHNVKLKLVLERLKNAGIHLKKEKCKFAASEIELLGFRVNEKGIQPSFGKVEAIHNAPIPKNKTELQSFLGLLNFYSCFLKGKSTILEPLHKLLRRDKGWVWNKEHDIAYKAAKNLLQKENILAHYDGSLPLVLTCDASSYGLGAVLSHRFPDNRELPIAYYSRTLTKPERNYSQTDREALAIIASVKKFNQYLLGRNFKIVTDHKPLLGLLNPNKPIPPMLSPRVLRWSLCLAAYDYDIEYRKGSDISNADAFSRLPLSTPDSHDTALSDVLLLETAPVTQLNSKLIASSTKKDPILSRVSLWILNGWPPKNSDPNFKPYFTRKNELSVHRDCILWGSRVIIPPDLQGEVLTLLHNAHPGIVRMKGLARSYVWWPQMDAAIEFTVKSCQLCQENQKTPAKAPIHPWEWTEKPWTRLHVDFAGPFQGQVFLIVVDSHSKWLEVIPVNSMSATSTIDHLRSLFATHGIPDAIASDNGSTFTSLEFRDFLQGNQIRQILVAPYHPSSNGQAERMVGATKQSLKRIIQGKWKVRLARFLFAQHTLPCTTTGKSPSELLMNRRLTSLLDRLHPDLNKEIRVKKETQFSTQSNKPIRVFRENDPVYIKNYGSGRPWLPATIIETTGPVSYKTANLTDGDINRRHVDQVRLRTVPNSVYESPSNLPDPPVMVEECPPHPPEVSSPDSATPPELDASTVVRRSQRTITKPKYLEDYVI